MWGEGDDSVWQISHLHWAAPLIAWMPMLTLHVWIPSKNAWNNLLCLKSHEKLASQKKKRKKVKSLSHVRHFVTSGAVAYQGPLSTGFSRQEYWSGLPCPSPGDLPNPGIEPRSPALRQTLYHLSHQGSPKRSCSLVKREHYTNNT